MQDLANMADIYIIDADSMPIYVQYFDITLIPATVFFYNGQHIKVDYGWGTISFLTTTSTIGTVIQYVVPTINANTAITTTTTSSYYPTSSITTISTAMKLFIC